MPLPSEYPVVRRQAQAADTLGLVPGRRSCSDRAARPQFLRLDVEADELAANLKERPTQGASGLIG